MPSQPALWGKSSDLLSMLWLQFEEQPAFSGKSSDLLSTPWLPPSSVRSCISYGVCSSRSCLSGYLDNSEKKNQPLTRTHASTDTQTLLHLAKSKELASFKDYGVTFWGHLGSTCTPAQQSRPCTLLCSRVSRPACCACGLPMCSC